MPQAILPIFPAEATPINPLVSFEKRDGQVYYFHGCMPVFSHGEKDLRSFRMFTSQLVVNGNCKQAEIVRAFGISAISVKRYIKKYRKGGTAAFFEKHRKRKPRVLTPEALQRAQEMLSQGQSRSEVAKALELKSDTLYKAVCSGRLIEGKKKAQKRAAQKVSGV